MTIPLGNDAVDLILRTLVTDDDGKPVLDQRRRQQFKTRNATKTDCSVELLHSSEQESSTDISGLTARVLLPYDADVAALTEHDAISYRDRVFEMTGPPKLWTDFDGAPDHVRCESRWQGG